MPAKKLRLSNLPEIDSEQNTTKRIRNTLIIDSNLRISELASSPLCPLTLP